MKTLLLSLYATVSSAVLPSFLGMLGLYLIYQPLLFRPHLERLSILLPRKRPKKRPRILLHAVSVGEVLSCAPFIRRLKEENLSVWLSTGTNSGFETAKKKYPGLTISYFPFDFPFAVDRFLLRVKPDVVFLCELEIWPYFVWSVNRREIPLYLISGRMVEKDYLQYRRFKWFFGHVFSMFTGLLMQNDVYTDRMRNLCFKPLPVKTMGSLKFDIIPPSADCTTIGRLMPEGFTLSAVSTHHGEEKLILEAFQSLFTEFPHIRLILVPRHPHRSKEIAQLLDKKNLGYTLRSENRCCQTAVFIVDSIGELPGIYQKTDLVIMGGSFLEGVGGHNIIEPASFGKCILCGNHMENFEEIYALFKGQKALSTTNQTRLRDDLKTLISHKEEADQIGRRALGVVRRNKGVTDRIIREVFGGTPVH